MARPRKNEEHTEHAFYITDSQYERMDNFASDCGISVSEFIEKVADALKNRKDKKSLMKLLKMKVLTGHDLIVIDRMLNRWYPQDDEEDEYPFYDPYFDDYYREDKND
ncbi:MAG: hypothetical protein ACI32O_11750 [Enterococcus sp.]